MSEALVADAASSDLEGLRILVVDDDPDGAELLAEVLTERGGEVSIALNGETALTTARAFVPHVVLLDLGLPDIDGFQVAHRLRGEPTLLGTRIVAVTGYCRKSDREETRAAGFAAHVVKPIDLTELFAIVAPQTDRAP